MQPVPAGYWFSKNVKPAERISTWPYRLVGETDSNTKDDPSSRARSEQDEQLCAREGNAAVIFLTKRDLPICWREQRGVELPIREGERKQKKKNGEPRRLLRPRPRTTIRALAGLIASSTRLSGSERVC